MGAGSSPYAGACFFALRAPAFFRVGVSVVCSCAGTGLVDADSTALLAAELVGLALRERAGVADLFRLARLVVIASISPTRRATSCSVLWKRLSNSAVSALILRISPTTMMKPPTDVANKNPCHAHNTFSDVADAFVLTGSEKKSLMFLQIPAGNGYCSLPCSARFQHR